MRDLPAKSGSVDPSAGFAMRWEATPGAAPRVAAIAAAAAASDRVLLATDPDREGEAISWHVLEELKARGVLPAGGAGRATFTSVTKDAVLAALASPRALSDDLVRAYFARRALDYLYGFSVSPLLWRRVPGARSAGRVQSAALALVASREAAVRAFVPVPFWSVDCVLAPAGGSGAPLSAALRALPGGAPVPSPGLTDAATAESAAAALAASTLVVASATARDVARSPPPPFVTASLQQAASALLGMSPSETMSIAQALYEGGDAAGGEPLITYMRTDGVSMPPAAVDAARDAAVAVHGAASVPKTPRVWTTRAKNAQEAHEAIRPTDARRAPSSLPPAVGRRHRALYDLIWRRTLASQMADARLKAHRVDVDAVAGPAAGARLRAAATAVVAPGFSAAYAPADIRAAHAADKREDREAAAAEAEAEADAEADADAAAAVAADDAAPPTTPGEDGALPAARGGAAAARLAALAPGDAVDLVAATAAAHETRPPPRFTEATLVAALEAAGVGRPSTYAPTVRLLLDRGYVEKAGAAKRGRALAAAPRGAVLAAYLNAFFGKYVDSAFTSDLEAALDSVAAGEAEWDQVVSDFWAPLAAAVAAAADVGGRDVVDALDATLGEALLDAAAARGGGAGGAAAERVCPACGGRVGLKLSTNGGFFGCANYPACAHVRPLWPDAGAGGVPHGGGSEPRALGTDPATGLPVTLRLGPYGPYVQLGPPAAEAAGEAAVAASTAPSSKPLKKKPPPRRASLPSSLDPDSLDLERALGLLSFPRVLGTHPRSGGTVEVASGKYGMYVRVSGGDKGISPAPLPADVDATGVGLAAALAALDARAARGGGLRAAAGGKAAAPAARKGVKAKADAGGGEGGAAKVKAAPKRAPSAYLLFCAAERPAVLAATPGASATRVMSELAARWKGLGEGERAGWDAKAAAAKAAFVPPPPGDAAPAKPKRGVKAAKAAGGAKRPLSAYLLFCGAERAAVVAANPAMPAAQVLGELGSRWRALGDAGQAEWKAKAKAAADAAPAAARAAPKAAVAADAPKRPPSAYILFCKAERAAVLADKPGLSAAQVLSELGARWRALPDADKARWKAGG